MATSKRAPAKPRKKAASGSKARGKGAARRGAALPSFSGVRERLSEVFNREVIGVSLLVCGLFFTAAFVTGRGAFLGDAGFEAVTRFMGRAGLLLAPLAALAGLLVLLRRLPVRGTLGVALLLIAAAGTLAAGLPPGRRFVAEAYEGAGGIVGSGVYAAVQGAGGFVGAVLALALLYALGLSLLTGVTFGAALAATKDAATGILARLGDWRANMAAAREGRSESRDRGTRKASEILAREDRSGAKGEPARGETLPGTDASAPAPSGAGIRAAYGEPVPRTREAPVVRDLYGELGEDEGADLPDGESRGAGSPGDGGREPGEKTEEFEILVPEPAGERRVGTPGASLIGERNGAGEEVDYVPPSPSLLDRGHGDPEHDAGGTSRRLTEALSDLGVEAQVLRAVVGPRVTRYELRLGSGVKVGKVRNLQQDIAYALAATEVRILAPIPGKSAVGVEVPNTRPAKVTLGDVFSEYPEVGDMALPVGLGKDIAGRPVFFDMADMPHLLVAGTTGSGKSVMLNALLTSLLLATDPRQVKMVLIDPKRVELSQFGRIPHLITPVVTDVKKAANALTWAVAEMERRYEVLERAQVRSLDGYNARADVPMPYVLVVIDELADLMMQAASKVEDAVIRIAQKARAVGIHLVVATQRPSVDVITGMIKANVPSRIAFAVSGQVDSRVILDTPGAESLLGMGDMLFKPVSAMRPSRVQGAFISEGEVERVVSATVEASKGRVEANFVEEVTESRAEKEEPEEPEDDLLPSAASFVLATQQASVSAVQRRFRVGYSRAGRIIDALERKGVVGPYEGSKSRAVIGTQADLDSLFGGEDPTDGAPDEVGPTGGAVGAEGPFDPFEDGGPGRGPGEGY